ncbi:hypothetical protein RJ55_01993 [Drechmeria coniospora]|nr:hypothetical protein RJ55_01993 [Drechmeria coniospora]
MADVQSQLQSLTEDYQKLQQDLQNVVASRQKLEGQRQENAGVQKEFDTMAEDETIYKLMGPVLLKQDKVEAESTVKGRLDFITGEIARLEDTIREIQEKMNKKKAEIIQIQASAQAQPPGEGSFRYDFACHKILEPVIAPDLCRSLQTSRARSAVDIIQDENEMEGNSFSRPARPQTVESLVTQAESFNFNGNIPFRHWVRAADTLFQEAHFALNEGDYARAYMMFYRQSVLVIKCMPTHPYFKDAENAKIWKSLSRRVDREILPDMEHLKPIIKRDYLEWEKLSENDGQQPPAHTPSSYEDYARRDPSLSGHAKVLDASEHQELAVDLAQKELARRDTVRRQSRFPLSSRHEAFVHTNAEQGGSVRRDDGSGAENDGDMRSQMEEARRALGSGRQAASAEASIRHGPTSNTAPVHYSYPSISKSEAVRYDTSHSPVETVPNRPPKESLRLSDGKGGHIRSLDHASLPAVPGKIPLETRLRPPSALADRPFLPPKAPLDGPSMPRKERFAFKPGAYLENGDPIRSIFLPSQLRSSFLDIASENTRAGLEMCGILCGTPVNNALFVRCLLIPDQKCTSDTCETENEGAMFDYCASEDLMVLGWIHTHPTQTCFMSSRDLHTHAGYQVMMPESIAIVCAPRFDPSYGIFRLTHPPGLDHILDCKHQDTFHQHSIGNIYTKAEHPYGHVYESDKMPFYVQDLRTK